MWRAGTSVLDATRVAAMLDNLAPAERKRAADGLALLAKGAAKIARKSKMGG